MKYLWLSILIVFSACSQPTEEQAMTLIKQVEEIGIERFYPIEYGKRGDYDIFSYHFNDTSYCVWNYSHGSLEFNFPYPLNTTLFEERVQDVEGYIVHLKEVIDQLDVEMISQSPWKGNIIRFWISNDKIISYVKPGFQFDTAPKKRWLAELNTGKRIMNNWYILTL